MLPAPALIGRCLRREGELICNGTPATRDPRTTPLPSKGSSVMADEAAKITFDKQEQLDYVKQGLMPKETLHAVYDAIGVGTGFIGLTDQRVIIQDNSFIGKRVAITSIPYGNVTSVSVVSNKSILGSFFSGGTIVIHVAAQTYEMTFRGEHKGTHVHRLLLHYMGVR